MGQHFAIPKAQRDHPDVKLVVKRFNGCVCLSCPVIYFPCGMYLFGRRFSPGGASHHGSWTTSSRSSGSSTSTAMVSLTAALYTHPHAHPPTHTNTNTHHTHTHMHTHMSCTHIHTRKACRQALPITHTLCETHTL